MPLVPFFAAILKVRPSRLGPFGDANPMLIGIRFHGTCPNREQGSALTRSHPPHQES